MENKIFNLLIKYLVETDNYKWMNNIVKIWLKNESPFFFMTNLRTQIIAILFQILLLYLASWVMLLPHSVAIGPKMVGPAGQNRVKGDKHYEAVIIFKTPSVA